MTSILLLAMVLAQDRPEEKRFELKVFKDGSVEFTVTEVDQAPQTYRAGSPEEFRRQHPDVARRHGLDRYLGLGLARGFSKDEFEKWWKEFKRNRPFIPDVPDFRSPLDEDWQKWMEEQRRRFDELRQLFRRPQPEPGPEGAPPPAPAPAGKEFGIKVDAVSATLRDQLAIKEGEGVVVTEVKPGSLAENAGLKTHDLILQIEGKGVSDKWQFRRDVLIALEQTEFTLEIVRAGRREMLKVRTGEK